MVPACLHKRSSCFWVQGRVQAQKSSVGLGAQDPNCRIQPVHRLERRSARANCRASWVFVSLRFPSGFPSAGVRSEGVVKRCSLRTLGVTAEVLGNVALAVEGRSLKTDTEERRLETGGRYNERHDNCSHRSKLMKAHSRIN